MFFARNTDVNGIGTGRAARIAGRGVRVPPIVGDKQGRIWVYNCSGRTDRFNGVPENAPGDPNARGRRIVCGGLCFQLGGRVADPPTTLTKRDWEEYADFR